jgi:2-dehydro-3-deoxygalactonokinase
MSFVAGDWGTTRLRVFLCDERGTVLKSAGGPGASQSRGRFPETLDAALAELLGSHERVPVGEHAALGQRAPVVLCGMVGSSFGWVQTPYVACPARPEQVAAACVPVRDGTVHIVPGLSCRSRLDAPDVLRGEETQILGAMSLDPGLARGRHLLCLPGTHTKWAVLDDGAVREFLTAVAGELFAVVRDHTVLVQDSNVHPVHDAQTFERALAHVRESRPGTLIHQIFECRSRRLNGELSPETAASYLSGLLIGSDVAGALALLTGLESQPVTLIGAPDLTRLYADALASHQRKCVAMEGDTAVVAGLARLHRLLSDREVKS